MEQKAPPLIKTDRCAHKHTTCLFTWLNMLFDETVRQNLANELSVIENEKEMIKVSHKLFLGSVFLVIVVMALGLIFKH